MSQQSNPALQILHAQINEELRQVANSFKRGELQDQVHCSCTAVLSVSFVQQINDLITYSPREGECFVCDKNI